MILQDLVHSMRLLIKEPGFTIVAVVTLAVAIGANSAIFSVVDAVLLRPLPYPDPERVVNVSETVRRESVELRPAAYPDFVDWRRENHVFESMAAWSNTSFTIGGGEAPERVDGEMVSPAYFEILGARPETGRLLEAADDAAPGSGTVAVIGHDLWHRHFGGRPETVGGPVTINGRVLTIVGVLPEGFRGLDDDTEVWIPMSLMSLSVPEKYAEDRGTRWHEVIARLKPGVAVSEAQAEMDTIALRLEQAYPDANKGRGIRLLPMAERFFGDVTPLLGLLFGAVGFVLLIACANVANLMLARVVSRSKETAIRAALGAGRGRLYALFITESVLLSFLGGGLGLLVALWGIEGILALAPASLPSFVHVGLDARVVGFTIGVSLLTGLLMGSIPALQASSFDLQSTLKEGGRSGGAGEHRGRARRILVVSEVAMASLLLVGAGLMIRSFDRMQRIDPGFDPDGLIALYAALPEGTYDGAKAWEMEQRLLEKVSALPAVASVALASDVPLEGSASATMVGLEGQSPDTVGSRLRVYTHSISPGYFRTVRATLMMGRDFAVTDGPETPPIAIASAAFAKKVWGDQDPIGRRFKAPGRIGGNRWVTIVGVAADMKHRRLAPNPLRDPADPDLYFAAAQSPTLEPALLVRASGDAASLTRAVQGIVAEMDRDVPVFGSTGLRDLIRIQTARARFSALLMGIFGGVALTLAAIGIYGVISYSVAQRTHEIGIRMALGADRALVMRLVMGQSMLLTVTGVAAGLGLALMLSRFLTALLYGVGPGDPLTFIGAPLVLAGVAMAASFAPARRATNVDPLTALRSE